MTQAFDVLERSLREGPTDEHGYRAGPLALPIDLEMPGLVPAAGLEHVGRVRPVPSPRPVWAGMSLTAVLLVAVGLAAVVAVRHDQPGLDPGTSSTPATSPSPSPSPSRGPTPSPSPSATPTPLPIPALTKTFVSNRNGFSVAYPAGWTVSQATKSWPPDIWLPGGNPALDALGMGSEAKLEVASQRLGAGQTPDAWLATFVHPYEGAKPCGVPPATAPRIPIGGLSGYLDVAACPGAGDITFPARNVGFDAIVFSGDRVYKFSLNGNVDLAYFEALLATVTFDPEHALDP